MQAFRLTQKRQKKTKGILIAVLRHALYQCLRSRESQTIRNEESYEKACPHTAQAQIQSS